MFTKCNIEEVELGVNIEVGGLLTVVTAETRTS
jgi:hypothetical protein